MTATAASRAGVRRVPALLHAGFEPPSVPDVAVVRRRLLSLLDVAAHQRLTVVVAPPGYGKTVLLAQWSRAHPGQRVRWLSIGPGDDGATFARRLLGALEPRRTVGAPAAPDGPAPDRGHPAAPFSVAALVAELDRIPPTTLVLDDFHELSDPALLDDLAVLIEHAPPALRFIIASQIDPPSRYFRLSLSDAVVELRQHDLAFTGEEASELIRRLAGIDLDAGRTDQLVQRTEGWAAGLQLAALSLRETPDVAGFVDAFAGDDRHVADYLTEHVIGRQPDDVRDFLLSTSVLDRMTAPLCEAVTGRRGAQAMLEELLRRSILITPLDATGTWFRYHRLFRTLLRHHLRDRDPRHERDLLRAAAGWHLAHDDPEAAVRYLAEAHDWEAVLDAASAHGGDMMARGRAGTVATWVRLVPPDVRRDRAGVALLDAASAAISGDEDRAVSVLEELDRSGVASRQERAVALLWHAYAELQRGRMVDAAATAGAALDAADALGDTQSDGGADFPDVLGLTAGAADVTAAARVVRGIALTYLGELADARESLREVAEPSHAMWQVSALGALALCEAWSGRLRAAEEFGNRALSLARQVAAGPEALQLDAYLALAGVARERGDLGPARALVEEARLRLAGARGGIGGVLVATEEALMALAEGQPAAGLTSLTAHRPAVHRPAPDAVVARQRAVEAQLLAMAGEPGSAARALDLAPCDTSDVVAARVLLAVNRGDTAAARSLIRRWPADPEPRAALESLLWLAVVEHLDGEEAVAYETMAAVVAEAALEENVGLFRSHHVLGPARALYRRSPTPFLRAVTDRPVPPSPPRRITESVDQLTEREYMVLPLLPTRLSNAEIADTLGVSLNTVKTHLKHIYRKLGVTERSEAIAAAERLHLW